MTVFLYCIGKLYYKNQNLKEVEKHFKEYAKIGLYKNNKAYFYLAIINKKKFNLKKYYCDLVESNSKIYDRNIDLNFLLKVSPEED